MKFSLIIPTRGDRPQFIDQCKKLIKRQTLQPTEVIWVDHKPMSAGKDITQRYRIGIEKATQLGMEFVVFWEDDDWYHPNYLQWLVSNWQAKGKPNFFGVEETYYYHLLTGNCHYDHHKRRTSAFCTLVKLPWKIQWPPDHYSFLDLHIFKNHTVETIMFPHNEILAIGIKHGTGLTGGGGHNSRFPFNRPNSRDWFYSVIGEDKSFYDLIKSELSKNLVVDSNQINTNIKIKTPTNAIQKRKISPNNSSPQSPRRGRTIVKLRKK